MSRTQAWWCAFRLWWTVALCLLRNEFRPRKPHPASPFRRKHRAAVLLRKVRGVGLAAFLLGVDTLLRYRDAQALHTPRQLALLAMLVASGHQLRYRPPSVDVDGYEHLRTSATLPQGNDFGPGITFDAATGQYVGTAVDTTEPAYTVIVPMSDTSNALTNHSNLQDAVNTAASSATGHTKITLPTGWVSKGRLILQENATGYRIHIGWDDDGALPTPSSGTGLGNRSNRVDRSYSGDMPQFQVRANGIGDDNGAPAILSLAGADNYTIQGVEITNPDARFMYHMIELAAYTAGGDDLSIYPKGIWLKQLLIDGGTGTNVRRAFFICGRGMAVTDSYCTNVGHYFEGETDDCQFVWVYGGNAYKFNNNYSKLRSAKQNYLFGGASLLDPTSNQFLQTDWEVQCNVFDSYDTESAPKGDVEVKSGVRGLMARNVSLHFDPGSPQNARYVFKTSDQSGLNNFCETGHLTVANNIVMTGPGFLSISGTENYHGTNLTHHICVKNNLVYGLDQPGIPFLLGGIEMTDIDIQYNTVIAADGDGKTVVSVSLWGESPDRDPPRTNPRMVRIVLRNNVLATRDTLYDGAYTLHNGDGGGTANSGWVNSVHADAANDFSHNVIVTATLDADYPGQLFADDYTAIGFVDDGANDYALTDGSPGWLASSDGTNVGYNKTVLDAAIALVAA